MTSLTSLPAEISHALANADYRSFNSIGAASDAELLAIDGIDEAAVQTIRALIPQGVQQRRIYSNPARDMITTLLHARTDLEQSRRRLKQTADDLGEFRHYLMLLEGIARSAERLTETSDDDLFILRSQVLALQQFRDAQSTVEYVYPDDLG